MFEASVAFDIQMVKGIANILAGGEGLFLATLTGPGRIWLHSMTVSKMAHRLMEYIPQNPAKTKFLESKRVAAEFRLLSFLSTANYG